MKERRRIRVSGIVQGVGYRPFVYGLATAAGLVGQVLNDSSGVTIEVEGETAVLDTFTTTLHTKSPPLAHIEQITIEQLPLLSNGQRTARFHIAASQSERQPNTAISPDVATCQNCLNELFDPSDRRYRYPFINCTNCGPRFTIIKNVPYDRSATTMATFPMCANCQREYNDPTNRRFHAQPNACPACGPQVQLSIVSEQLSVNSHQPLSGDAAVGETQRLLAQGAIVAIKGLGGYHLACDATNQEAVQRLRAQKHRWDKPFALMAADVETVETVCEVNKAERNLLSDHKRPIVLLNRKAADQKSTMTIATAVAPNQKTLGMMLPYTPLHHLLLADSLCPFLVMTSGNLSDEPIAYQDDEATTRLSHIADAILSHNRPIYMRCDDSVVRILDLRFSTNETTRKSTIVNPKLILRRSRGYAPQPIPVSIEFQQPVLAVGAHQKNTFCLGKGNKAFLSHHIGDLDNLETLASFQEGIDHFRQLFAVETAVIAHDYHPDYLSTKWAQEQQAMRHIPVQHHHAHIASVMVEHKLHAPVIGVALDGSGYGLDGTIWGSEFLIADFANFDRVAHLRPVALPGGEQAIRQPWRVAAAWLQQLYGDEWPLAMDSGPLSNEQWAMNKRQVWPVLRQMIERQLNSPLTSSMGRLFDAVATLLNVRHVVTYEGQAAIELEALADESVTASYTFSFDWPQINPAPLFAEIMADLERGCSVSVISAKFHNGVAAMITAVCQRLRQTHGLNQVALSGGVFQNSLLLTRTLAQLQQQSFQPFINQQVPPNDGGIAFGQAAIAAKKLCV